MVKAYEVLGDVVALRGNLSPSMMTTGRPDEVDAAVRHLAENVFHKGGKLLFDCAFGVPDETPSRECARDVRGGTQVRKLSGVFGCCGGPST